MALLRAMAAIDAPSFTRTLATVVDQDRDRLPGPYRRELAAVLPGAAVTDWFAIGHFPAAEEGTVARVDFGPESDASTSRIYEGKDGVPVTWTRITADASGYLDLRSLTAEPDDAR